MQKGNFSPDRGLVVYTLIRGNSTMRSGLHTGGLSCKFLYMFSRLHAWLDCLGCGTTTGRSEHRRAPNTLPTQTMMTSHSALQYDKADLMQMKNNTQYMSNHPLWIWCISKMIQGCVFDRPTCTVWVRLASLRPSSLTNANLTVHLYLLAWPVAHTCHLTHTLLW